MPNYPYVKEGVKFEHNGLVAATFCAESKNEKLTEGTPKDLWYDASSRIKSFIDFCEHHNIPYVILSYKYGIVAPNEVIDNYNISKDQVDFEEWTQLVNNRADELGIKKLAHLGFLAFASKDIREALESTKLDIIWCDDFDDLYNTFYRQQKLSLIKDVEHYDPSKVSNDVLLDDHRITHAWWALCHKLDNFPYSCKQVKKLHDDIVKEMERRGMKHNSPLEEVRSVSGLKELIRQHGIKVTELADDNTADLSDQELKAMHALSHAKKDCETHEKIVAEMQKRGMAHESPCDEQMGEEKSSSTETFLEDRITLLKYFTPLKGILGYRSGEVYKVENLKEFISDDDYPVAVEKKYDGVRLQWHKKGKTVKVYSDGGEDVTHRLPTFVRILQGDDWPEEVILDTETEMWVDGEHKGREETSGFLRKEEPAKPGEDRYIVPNVFDVVWFKDKRFAKHDINAEIGDLHEEPLEVRHKYLDLLPFKQSVFLQPSTGEFNRVVTFWANSFEELKKHVEKVSKPKESEGAMIKIGNSTYPFSGMTRKWIKYKKMAELHVITLEKLETKTEGVFNYKIGIATVPEYKYPEEDLMEVGGKKYLYIGKTFNTDEDVPDGTILTVTFHTLFLYEGPDNEIRIRIYEPRVYEARLEQKTPDTVKDAIGIAEKADLLERKKLTDPFLIIPPEDKTWKFVYQHHHRGRTVHGDLRLQISDSELVGWTIAEQPDEDIEEPTTTLEQARELEEKLDWKLLKQNKHVYVTKKAVEPIEWLDVEGVVPPGGIGATRNFPGVFLISDKGAVEYGFQESDFHEYFLHGNKLKGRFIVRQIPTRDEEGRTHTLWNAWFPDEQLPYIISKDAVKKGRYPPKGYSLLPKVIREKIPDEYQYWKKDNYKEVRDKLVEALEKGEVKLYLVDRMSLTTRLPTQECVVYKNLADGYHLVEDLFTGDTQIWEKNGEYMMLKSTTFRLAHHWWRGPIVVREGPSTEHYDLFIDQTKMQIELSENPLTTPEVSALFNTESYDKLRNVEGEIKPGEPGNPTKETPAYLETVTEGKCIIYENDDLFKKIGLYYNNKEVIFIFTRTSIHDEIWTMKQVEGSATTMKLSFKGVEKRGNKWYVKGFGLAEGVWNGMFFPSKVIEESAHLLIGKQADIEHNDKLKWGVVTKAEYVPDETAIYVEVETEDEQVVKDIEAGKYRGFSIDAWTVPDPVRRIIKKILDYDAITITSNPACGVCIIGAGCT